MATLGDSRTRQSQQAASDATSPQFSDALDAEERDRSARPAARINRPQVMRKPVATADTAAQTTPAAQPADTDTRPAPKTGAEGQQTKAGETPAADGKTDAPAAAPAEPDKKDDAKGAAPSPEQPQPVVQTAVPQLAPQPTAGPAEATISGSPTVGEEAIKAIAEAVPTAATAPAAGAQPAADDPKAAVAPHAEAATAVAQAAAPAAKTIGAGEQPAEQTPQPAGTTGPTTAQGAAGGKTAAQPEQATQQPATEVQKPDVKADAKPDFRSEASASQTPAATQAASGGGQAPDAQPTIPTPASHTASSGPLSFVGDIAQKVAAQTQAPGSVVPVHAVAVAIAARATTGSTRFDIKLDPAELGRIEVSLTLDREGRVKSKIVAEKPETLELLQRDQRNLERTLSQAGLNTSEGSVEFSLKDQGQRGAERDQSQGGQRHWQGYVEDTEAQPAPHASAANYARLAAARGGVDIRI